MTEVVQLVTPQQEDYETVMIGCMHECNFNKRRAVRMFRERYPAMLEQEWFRVKAYKIYDKVVGNMQAMPETQRLLHENVEVLREALALAVEGGKLDAVCALTDRVMRMLGLDRQNILIQNNSVNLQQTEQERLGAIRELVTKLGLAHGTGAGAITTGTGILRQNQSGEAPVSIPATPQTGAGTQQ